MHASYVRRGVFRFGGLHSRTFSLFAWQGICFCRLALLVPLEHLDHWLCNDLLYRIACIRVGVSTSDINGAEYLRGERGKLHKFNANGCHVYIHSHTFRRGVFPTLEARFMKGDKKVLRFKAKLRNVADNDKKRNFVVNYCEKTTRRF